MYLLYFGLITAMAFKDTTMCPYGWTDTQLYLVFLFGILVVFAKAASDQSWKWYEIILAAAVILTISKNNPVDSAKEAKFKEDVRSFRMIYH